MALVIDSPCLANEAALFALASQAGGQRCTDRNGAPVVAGSAGNDGFQEDLVLVLHKRNKKHITFNVDNEYALTWISLLI